MYMYMYKYSGHYLVNWEVCKSTCTCIDYVGNIREEGKYDSHLYIYLNMYMYINIIIIFHFSIRWRTVYTTSCMKTTSLSGTIDRLFI